MAKKNVKRGQGSIYQRRGLWWCDYSAGGVRKRESCKTKSREEALAYLHRKLGSLAEGKLLTPDRVSISDLLKLLLDNYDLRGVAQQYIATLKIKSVLGPKLGHIKAAKLTTARVNEYIRDRLKTVKPGTINRELGLLHRAFKIGYDYDPPLVGRVPSFPKLPEDEPRKGFLKPQDYRKLLAELPEELRLAFVVAYHVGLRKGALLRIKWSQVELPANTIWMEGKRQNRKPEPVAVPIYGDMAKYLEMQPRTSEYLFARGSKPIKDFRESWDQACVRAGVPELLFHDLRRREVRNLRRAGVPESVIMKITGHRTRSVFERYNITDHSDTQDAGRRAGEFLKKEHEDVAQLVAQNSEEPNEDE
jgi:integrase